MTNPALRSSFLLLVSVLVCGAAPSAANPPASNPRAIRRLLEAGHYPAAESDALQLLALLERSHAAPPRIAEALDLLVESLVGGGWFLEPRALALAESAVAIRAGHPGRDSLDLARSLFGLAMVRSRRDEDSLAAPLFERVVSLRTPALGPTHSGVAEALHELAWCRYGVGRNEEADSLFHLAAALRDPRDARGIAQSRMAVAFLTNVHGSPDSILYVRAVAATEQAFGLDHPMLATHLIWFGGMLRNRARYDHAAAVNDRAIEIDERALGATNLLTARAINRAGMNRLWSGRIDLAIARFRSSLEIVTKLLGSEHLETAQHALNLGDAYHRSGDEAAARPLLEQAVRIYERDLPPHDERLLDARDNLAIHYLTSKLGSRDVALARSLLRGTIAILVDRGPSLSLAHAYDYLAQATPDTSERNPLYRKAAGVYIELYGPDSPSAARGWNLLGWLAALSGDYEQAIPQLERAIEMAARTRPNGQEHGWGEIVLGHALRGAGRPSDATLHFERAVHIFENALGRDHTVTGMGWRELGAQLAAVGEDDSAFAAIQRAEQIHRSHLEHNIRVLPESQAIGLRSSWVSARSEALGMLVSLAISSSDAERIQAAWDEVVRSRALVLDEMALRQRALFARPDPVVRQQLARMDSLSRERLRLEASGTTQAESRERLRATEHEQETILRALAERSAGTRERQSLTVGLGEVIRSLPPRSALLAFWKHQRLVPARTGYDTGVKAADSYAAFLVRSGDSHPAAIELGDADRIERGIEEWRGEVSCVTRGTREEERYRRAGAALRRLVWDPLAARLDGIERVFVVPDGSLDLLSFATLPVGSRRYLIENGRLFHYVSAERDLVPPQDVAPRGAGLLALGDPAFDVDPPEESDRNAVSLAAPYRGPHSACTDFHDVRFGALPQSGSELEDVTRLWRSGNHGLDTSSVILRGARASEEAFKRSAPGRRCLHLATHGFFLGSDCGTDSSARGIGGLTVEGASDSNAALPRQRDESPLLLSGLALAGANRRAHADPDRDDGILTSEEIAALDLSSVEWAVLSACETGLGEVRAGEGVLGLRRGLQIAGVRTSIMSLWSLSDRDARQWMHGLYAARWGAGLDTPRSMRAASLTMLEEQRARGASTHPASWGAFIAVGDWH